MVYRGLCQGQSRRFGLFGQGRVNGNFVDPFGVFAPSQMLSLAMRRFMHLYPITTEHMAEIALNARANANRNPNAVMHSKKMLSSSSRKVPGCKRLLKSNSWVGGIQSR